MIGGRAYLLPATDTIFVYSGGAITTSTARLAVARDRVSAIRLPSGDVLVAGGLDENGFPLASTEIYSPATDSVRPGPSLSTERVAPFLALEGGTVFAFGGSPLDAGAAIEEWTVGSPTGFVPTPARLAVARVGQRAIETAPGTFLVHGGVDAASVVAPNELVTLGVGGHAIPSPAGIRTNGSLVHLGGHFYVMGGELGGTPVADADELVGDALVAVPSVLPEPRALGAPVQLTDDTALILGGRDVTNLLYRATIFLETGAAPDAGPALDMGRQDCRATKLEDTGAILVSGGDWVNADVTEEVELITPR